MYKDVVNLAKTKNIDISKMKENNEEHKIDLDAHVNQYIVEQIRNQSDNNMSLGKKTNTDNKNKEDNGEDKLYDVSIQLSHNNA